MSIEQARAVGRGEAWHWGVGVLLLAGSGCGKLLGLSDTQLTPIVAGAGVGGEAARALAGAGYGGDPSDGGSGQVPAGVGEKAAGGVGEKAAAGSGVATAAGEGGLAAGGVGGSGEEAGGVPGSGAAGPDGGAGGRAPVIPVGAIVSHDGSCLAVAATDGAVVTDSTAILRSCADDPAERWSRGADGQLGASDLSGAFLTAPDLAGDVGGTGSAGAALWAAPLVDPVPAGQAWVFQDVSLVSDWGEQCVDVAYGDFQPNAQVQLYPCNDGVPQEWTITSAGLIKHGDYCFDLPDQVMTEGTLLQIWPCKDPIEENQRFVLDHGRIKLPNGKCLGVVGEPPIAKKLLQVVACDMPNDTRPQGLSFVARGRIMNQEQCLEAGIDPSTVGLSPCSGDAPGQVWDYYF